MYINICDRCYKALEKAVPAKYHFVETDAETASSFELCEECKKALEKFLAGDLIPTLRELGGRAEEISVPKKLLVTDLHGTTFSNCNGYVKTGETTLTAEWPRTVTEVKCTVAE